MVDRVFEFRLRRELAWTLAGAALIVLATVVAYLPAIRGGFIWDDDLYVSANRFLRDLEGLKQIWIPTHTPQYYPVVFTSFWIEHHLWQLNPMGYHIVNVVLHALNALLVWRLCTVLKLPGGLLAGWLIAAVFALHPVHVESVAWITERKNVLSAFFYLTAALAYLRFESLKDVRAAPTGEDARPTQTKGQPRRTSAADSWGWYGLSLLLFVLALLSKSVTCSLPAALILMMLWQRKRLTIPRLAPLAPMLIIGLLLALHTAHIEREHVGAEGDDFVFSWIDRILIASNALLFYPRQLLWPQQLMFVYPRWQIDPNSVILWMAGAGAIAIGATSLFLYRRGVRGPALALAFYAGTIFPALGFVNMYPMRFSFVADHFQYLASLGIIALVIGG
ncbi:MAG: hypothetical protein L0Y42_13380 [Phycisphaerales bacterium]|nr:hypothetical protein [Phycisphaerales bacterium]